MDISKIDKNLKVNSKLIDKDIVWYDVRNFPFDVYGFFDYKNESVFRRLPEKIAKAANEGVRILHTNTAGGRVRFKTDSPYIAINAVMPSVCLMAHMSLMGSAGFDLYSNNNGISTYRASFTPPIDMKNGYETVAHLNNPGLRSYTINFPLYNDVTALYIGLKEGSVIEEGEKYKYQKPVLFYGSSITQGGCTSRPGNCYQNFISRRFDTDYINLGFSGSAKAEDTIVRYMSEIDMSMFVCDYDHNAPDVEYLEKTYFAMYETIRGKHKTLPYIMISKPDFDNGKEVNIARRNIIYSAYMHAVESGDRNVYYIDGERLFGGEERDTCTVDGCHPNDIGFMRMADAIGSVIKGLL